MVACRDDIGKTHSSAENAADAQDVSIQEELVYVCTLDVIIRKQLTVRPHIQLPNIATA